MAKPKYYSYDFDYDENMMNKDNKEYQKLLENLNNCKFCDNNQFSKQIDFLNQYYQNTGAYLLKDEYKEKIEENRRNVGKIKNKLDYIFKCNSFFCGLEACYNYKKYSY